MPLADAARELIDRHELQPHPEGGWFRETWRASQQVPSPFGARPAGTLILYLIGGVAISRLHRLRQDEVWCHHAGPGLALHVIDPSGTHHVQSLGPAAPQAVAPAGYWQGAEAPDGWALVSCACMPGFDFADHELADRAELLSLWPQHAELVTRLTR